MTRTHLPGRRSRRTLGGVLLVALLSGSSFGACSAPSGPPPPRAVTAVRPLGTWEGQGSRTIGFTSESGRFRVAWRTRVVPPGARGTFRLTIHSAVSGRPIQLIADHQGEGSGNVQVDDDPRPYNAMVESSGVEWLFSVEDLVASVAKF